MADVEFTIGAVDQASRVISMVSGNFGTLGNIVASLAGGNYFGALTTALNATIGVFKQAIKLAADEETSLVKLGATIKSMGLESQTSAEKVRGLAEEMMKMTNIPHEDLEAAAQVFMRMDDFDPSNLERMLQITADFAAGTGQNAAAAAQSIATALETGATRSLHFSAELRTQVQEMVKAGDSGGALALVMDTLNSKYGGQAAAQMDTYAGKIKQTKLAWEEAAASVGNEFIPGLVAIQDLLIKSIELTDNQRKALVFLGIALNDGSITIQGYTDKLVELGIPLQYGEYSTTQLADATDYLTHKFMEENPEVLRATEYTNSLTTAINTAIPTVEDLGKRYSAVTDLAGIFETQTIDMTTAQNNLTAALKTMDAEKPGTAAYEAAKAKVDEVKDSIDKLKQAQQEQTDRWVLNIITQQLSLDGLTSKEMAFLLQYQIDTGLITVESARRAQKEYEYALKLAASASNARDLTDALHGIPNINRTVTITTNYNTNGSPPGDQGGGGSTSPVYPPSGGGGGGTQIPLAGGGSFSGWAMVGDTTSGRTTPYTEYVYAPHGAVVYNQAQMSGRSAPPMANGGFIPPMSGGVDLSDSSLRKLSDLITHGIAKIL